MAGVEHVEGAVDVDDPSVRGRWGAVRELHDAPRRRHEPRQRRVHRRSLQQVCRDAAAAVRGLPGLSLLRRPASEPAAVAELLRQLPPLLCDPIVAFSG